jgi:hypothetical protein
MLIRPRRKVPVNSPVLVVDALGFAAKIRSCDGDALIRLSDLLDRQYHAFKAKIPFAIMLIIANRIFGSRDFSHFRINDMFILFSEKSNSNAHHRHVVASSLLYQALLLEGFVPRGGLGAGLVLRTEDTILGQGFIDAYEASEKRPQAVKNICAIHVSEEFVRRTRPSRMTYQLLCFYEGRFFINPRTLADPDMGVFDNDRIIGLLRTAGANAEKLDATERFLQEFEDYETAQQPSSRSWESIRAALAGEGGKKP